MRARVSAGQLRALANMIDSGLANGYIEVEYNEDDDFDSVVALSEGRAFRIQRRHRAYLDLEFDRLHLHEPILNDVPYQGVMSRRDRMEEAEARYQEFAKPKSKCTCAVKHLTDNDCAIHNWQHRDFGKPIVSEPPAPDYQGAVNTLVNIIKVIQKAQKLEQNWDLFSKIVKTVVRAWTMDDSSKRFAALELD